MKKLFCATLIIFLICGEKFPNLGESIGNGVRLREAPDNEEKH